LGGKEKKKEKIGNEGKREKRGKGLESSPENADYPKTVIVDAVDAAEVVVVANRGTTVSRIVAPGTAPQRRTIIIPIFYPDTAIRRRTVIVIVPGIGAPLPDIAVHIVQSKGVWGKLSHGSCFVLIFSVRFIGVGITGIVVSQFPRNGFPKVKRGGGSSTTSVFPFRFTR
jgi:hypothetical protein